MNPSPFDAAAGAMAVMGIAGEMAGERSQGPASFLVAFLDALYLIAESDIRARLRLEEA
ncbi:MAG: hydroxyethylthiazole kinase [Acidobacteria bacterium]|nr:hydroxyethylthiazole kinase [Acidobacteriota bacterium]